MISQSQIDDPSRIARLLDRLIDGDRSADPPMPRSSMDHQFEIAKSAMRRSVHP
jgi:hypothetical protein